MASPTDMIVLASLVVNLCFFLAVVMLWREHQSERRERLADRDRFDRHTHTLASGRVFVPQSGRATRLPPPPSSGPVAVFSSRERADPLAQTVKIVEPVDDRPTIVELATTMPSAGEVRR